MGEVIVVTSGKGGVGKTTTTANLGAGLSLLGKRVALVDTDMGLRNLDVLMGLENDVSYDIVDVISHNCKIKQAMLKDNNYESLYLLPASQTRDKDSVTPDQVKKLIKDLKKEFDYVIIDCPAGIEGGFKNAIAGADSAIIVTTPEIFSVRDADRATGLLKENGFEKIQLIVNKLRPNMVKSGDMMSADDVSEVLGIKLIGAVRDDEDVIISSNAGHPLAGSDSVLGHVYMDICKRILGEDVPFTDVEEVKEDPVEPAELAEPDKNITADTTEEVCQEKKTSIWSFFQKLFIKKEKVAGTASEEAK